MKPTFTLEKWTHGWVLCAPHGTTSVPIGALRTVYPLIGENAVMDPGIVSFLCRSNRTPQAVFAFGDPEPMEEWRNEIQAWLDATITSPHMRWWCGLDTGESSESIFRVLSPWKPDTLINAGHTPADADDFGRCSRLVSLFGWRDRLPEVAAAYPQTLWPAIIARWDELCGLDATGQCKLLREIKPLLPSTKPEPLAIIGQGSATREILP